MYWYKRLVAFLFCLLMHQFHPNLYPIHPILVFGFPVVVFGHRDLSSHPQWFDVHQNLLLMLFVFLTILPNSAHSVLFVH